MRKFLLALSMVTIIGLSNLSAKTDVAIGLEFGGGGIWGTSDTGTGGFGGLGINMAFGETPQTQEWATTFRVDFGGGVGIQGHFEKYMIHHSINEWFFLYLGIGAGVNWSDENNDWYSNITFNVPLGMRFLPEGWIDVFLELVPTIGMGFSDNNNVDNETNVGFAGGINFNFGIRFWIGAGTKATSGS